MLLLGEGVLPGGEAFAGAFVFGEAMLVGSEGLLLLLPGVVVGLLSCLQGGGVGVVRALGGEGGKAGGAVLLAGAQGEGLLVKRGGFAGKGFAGGGGQARGLPFAFCGEGCDGARGGKVLFFLVEGGLLVGEAAAQLFALLLVGSHAVFGLLQRAAGVFGSGFGGGDGALLGGFFGVGVALAEDGAAGGAGLCVGVL